MNCREFENVIHEIVSRGAADNPRHLDGLEHAGQCLPCALRLDEERALTESLQAFARTLDLQRAPARVEETLVRAFRERAARAATPRFGFGGKRVWRWLAWGVVFAATVAGAYVILRMSGVHPGLDAFPVRLSSHPAAASEAASSRHEQPNLPGPGQAKVSMRSAVSQSSLAAHTNDQPGAVRPRVQGPAAPVLEKREPDAAARAASRRRLESDLPDPSALEAGADFILLGSCSYSECMDDATLVRMSLPAEAPLAFGFPMSNDWAPGGSVEADVALGSDGIPLAIRFVN